MNVPTMTVLMSNSPRRGNQPTWVISVPRRLSIRQPPTIASPMAAAPMKASTRRPRPSRAVLPPPRRATSQPTPAATANAPSTTSTICQPRPGSASVTCRTKSQASNANVPMINRVMTNVVSAPHVSTVRASRSRNRRPRLVCSVIGTVVEWSRRSKAGSSVCRRDLWKRTARPARAFAPRRPHRWGDPDGYSPPSRVPTSRASQTACVASASSAPSAT